MAGFYQEFWDVIKDDLISIIHYFFIQNQMRESLIETTIVFIPK